MEGSLRLCAPTIAAVMLALAMAAGQPVLAQPSAGGGLADGRAVHVFGDLLLDYQVKAEIGTAPRGAPLTDCSNAELFCSRGKVFRFVLPKGCAAADKARPGDVWTLGDISTTVLGRRTVAVSSHDTPGPRLLLGDVKRPNVVFEYVPAAGIVGVYVDLVDGRDLVAAAKGAEGERFSQLAGRTDYRPRKSFDSLGACVP